MAAGIRDHVALQEWDAPDRSVQKSYRDSSTRTAAMCLIQANLQGDNFRHLTFGIHLIDEQLQPQTCEHLPKNISIRVSRFCNRKPPAITELYQFPSVLGHHSDCSHVQRLPSQIDSGAPARTM